MRTPVTYLGVAAACALLLACAGGVRHAAAPSTPPAPQTADELYRLGRSEHHAHRLEAARGAYLRALQADPGHLHAGNGLAVLYAAEGDYQRAIAMWRNLSEAGGGGPDSAFLFGNLGYAYFLNGELEPALAALEKACWLDPLNGSAWRHLGGVLEKLGQGARAALMFKQAQSLQEHDPRADYALVRQAGSGLAGAPAETVRQATPGGTYLNAWPAGMPYTEVKPVGAGQVQVRRVAARQPTVRGEAPAAPADAELGGGVVRLEIRNGNGVAGMAAAAARIIASRRFQVIRLANEGNFQVAATRIEYGAEREAAAHALAKQLGAPARAAEARCLAADLRLILGRDMDAAALRRRYLKSAGPG